MNRLRRRLLIAAGLVGGALVVGGYFLYRDRDRLRVPEGLATPPNQNWLTGWLRIGTDGTVTVAVPRQEMGQGISAALPMLVAEELDCDPASLRYEQAPVDPLYANATVLGDSAPFRPDDQSWMARLARHTQFKFAQVLGIQATGGSTSTRDAWEVMRQAGAAARAMLIAAAHRVHDLDAEIENLKLTIAKYLTPGDVSIQEVGIIPDIELIPTRITKERLDVFAPRKTVGEANLEDAFVKVIGSEEGLSL